MVIEITQNQLDAIKAEYNHAFALHRYQLYKGLLDSANFFMTYVGCIENTMRAFGFVPAYNHSYDHMTGENFLSGWRRINEDGE